jgi:hypothetical protein
LHPGILAQLLEIQSCGAIAKAKLPHLSVMKQGDMLSAKFRVFQVMV